jgi:hypothetical protein
MVILRGSPRFGSEAAWMIALKVECRECSVFSWFSKFISIRLGCEICMLGSSARRELSIYNGWCFCCFGVRVIIDFIHIPSEQALPTSIPEKSNLTSSLQFKSSRLELPFLRKIEVTTPHPRSHRSKMHARTRPHMHAGTMCSNAHLSIRLVFS